jgi:hypothetical protein
MDVDGRGQSMPNPAMTIVFWDHLRQQIRLGHRPPALL